MFLKIKLFQEKSALSSSPLLLFLWAAAVLIVAVGVFALIFSYASLPAQVPLLFTAEQGLTGKIFLPAVPLLALIFLVGNAVVSKILLQKRESAAALFPAFLALLVSSILTGSLIRILRIFPLPSSTLEELIYPLVLPLATAIVLGFGTALAVLLIARYLKLLDRPHGPYPQVRPLPRLGALPIFASFAAAAVIFLPLDPALKGILLGGGILTLIQTIDDIRPLPFWIQGLGHLAAAGAVVWGGIKIDFIGNPLAPYLGPNYLHFDAVPYLSEIVTGAWIFAFINIVDWLDGLDGLAAGVGAIAAFSIVAISLLLGTPASALLGVILAGALLGFLPLNFYPAQIYLGGGAFLLGFLLAVLSIFSGAKTGTALLVLAIPILDALYVIYSRIRSGKSPFVGDKNHLHHRLLKAGIAHPRIVLTEWAVVLILAVAAIFLRGFAKFLAVGLVFPVALLANKLLLGKLGARGPKPAEPATSPES